jgi:hypothetical protein
VKSRPQKFGRGGDAARGRRLGQRLVAVLAHRARLDQAHAGRPGARVRLALGRRLRAAVCASRMKAGSTGGSWPPGGGGAPNRAAKTRSKVLICPGSDTMVARAQARKSEIDRAAITTTARASRSQRSGPTGSPAHAGPPRARPPATRHRPAATRHSGSRQARSPQVTLPRDTGSTGPQAPGHVMPRSPRPGRPGGPCPRLPGTSAPCSESGRRPRQTAPGRRRRSARRPS